MTAATKPPIEFDLFIIGGGINGVAIAADAAGRGLRVALCDRGDLGGQTSSKSSKFFHGDIRYLEKFELGLVRKSLLERNLLMRRAPHLTYVQQYRIPCNANSRPLWKLKLLLSGYDWLGNNYLDQHDNTTLPPLGTTASTNDLIPLRPEITHQLTYQDCQVDDARLVISNALLAAEKGATVLPYTHCKQAHVQAGRWLITLEDTHPPTGANPVHLTCQVSAKAVVNAAGPWANRVLKEVTSVETRCSTVLARGSHVVIPKFMDHNMGYILQHQDKRIITLSPFEEDYYLVGHSSAPHTNRPEECTYHAPAPTSEEIDYLLNLLRDYFQDEAAQKACQAEQIKRTYSSLWPLYDCELENREQGEHDYLLDLQTVQQTPLVTVFGGRLTTHRLVAEQVLSLLSTYLKPACQGSYSNWTENNLLPGGNLPSCSVERFIKELIRVYPKLPAPLLNRYARRYGTRTLHLLGARQTLDQLGPRIGPQQPSLQPLYERECQFLIESEWARQPDDILWRRTQQGLHFTTTDITQLHSWWNEHYTAEPAIQQLIT